MLTLQDKQRRTAVCVREGAHGRYMLRAGAKCLLYHPPLAFYDADTDSFDVGSAGMQGDFETDAKVSPLAVARWHVAGAIAEKTLTSSPYADESGGRDREDFPRTMRRYAPDISDAELEGYWRQATKEVEADLRSPMVQKEIWNFAHKFEAWLLEEK